MTDLVVTIPSAAISAAVNDALLKPARYSHEEAPMAAAARAVVAARLPQLEAVLSSQVEFVLNDASVRTALQTALRQALAEAVTAKAKSLVRSMSQQQVLAVLGCGTEGECEGAGRCHGTQRWCSWCGDVSRTCDMADCDVHRLEAAE